jgi:hypothetical protein
LTRCVRTTTVHEKTTSGSKSIYDGHRDMRASQEMKKQTKRRKKRQQREAATVNPAAAPPGKATLEHISGETDLRSKIQGGSKKTLYNLNFFLKDEAYEPNSTFGQVLHNLITKIPRKHGSILTQLRTAHISLAYHLLRARVQ